MKVAGLKVGAAICAMCVTSGAFAEQPAQGSGDTLTIEQASQYLRYSGGNDRFRVEVAPNYSEEFGFSLKGAAGGYLTDALALGLIVEYGEDMREYLANAGIQFNDELSFVGTVGLLEQRYEYVKGEGKDTVQQMEYGASLKGAYDIGVLSGFELNGYLTNADADSKNVETGQLYGIQLMADFDLTSTTFVEIGGGYEWLEWDDTNEDNSQFTFSAEAAQQLGDALSLTGNVKLGASEYVYGGGLAYDLSSGGMNTNRLSLNYNYIDGRHGIEDDQRVELSWSYGFGAGPTQTTSVETQDTAAIRPVADVAMVSPANNLLSDVMKRPSFLPELVVARSAGGCSSSPNIPLNTNYEPSNTYYFDSTVPEVFVWLYIPAGSTPLPVNEVVLNGTPSDEYGGAYVNPNDGSAAIRYNFPPQYFNNPSPPLTADLTIAGFCVSSLSLETLDN